MKVLIEQSTIRFSSKQTNSYNIEFGGIMQKFEVAKVFNLKKIIHKFALIFS